MYSLGQDVLKFLESEYSDSYQFELTYCTSLDSNKDTAKLSIRIAPRYIKVINTDWMYVIFGWYTNGTFIKERNQYRWQKELIDIIEGS